MLENWFCCIEHCTMWCMGLVWEIPDHNERYIIQSLKELIFDSLKTAGVSDKADDSRTYWF